MKKNVAASKNTHQISEFQISKTEDLWNIFPHFFTYIILKIERKYVIKFHENFVSSL